MKNLIINSSINYIQKYNNYTDTKIREIRYGLEAIYLNISKFLFISIIAFILGIFKEMIIFTLIFYIIRSVAFGLHATKSWICLISSTFIFIVIPFSCYYLYIPIIIKIIFFTLGVLLIYKNSPADTYKRPIVNKRRRNIYKLLSVIVSLIYMYLSLYTDNNFLSNCFIFSIVLQNLLISPIVYKLFNLPYNNYIDFLKKHPEFSN